MAITFQAGKPPGPNNVDKVRMAILKDGQELGTWLITKEEALRLSFELCDERPINGIPWNELASDPRFVKLLDDKHTERGDRG